MLKALYQRMVVYFMILTTWMDIHLNIGALIFSEITDLKMSVLRKEAVTKAWMCLQKRTALNTPFNASVILVQEVHTGKEIYGCHVGVVMTNRHFTQGAIAAAKATRVMLWDREKILELMNTTKLSITNPPTVSQWETNALIAAKDYIKSDHYSYQELIEQLEYDGYTTKQATYAADNCGGDWFSQAERAAKSYLSTDLFSPSELIEQLELDGFTHDQAQYAISCIN